GHGNDAIVAGVKKPTIEIVDGRHAVTLAGGEGGTSYLKLPDHLLNHVSDHTGITVSTWVYLRKGENVWERIFDFGSGIGKPYLFLTRQLRGVCFLDEDLIADAGKTYPSGEWLHIAMSITGTEGGALSNAGPIIYVNGELVADGLISQTSSGTYKKLQQWFNTFSNQDHYSENYIGKSHYYVDPDFDGSLTDGRV